jgi:Uma2 family endonuclease
MATTIPTLSAVDGAADTAARTHRVLAPPGWEVPPGVPEGEAPNVDWVALRKVYPESDGQPMADNTKQWRYIATIVGELRVQYLDRPDVFVAGDLLWYPVEGRPEICRAPDALVAFGRPKGDRGSYLQWLEGGVTPQVVFEVLSPKNTAAEMAAKQAWYDHYGVQEYYEIDPGDPDDLRKPVGLRGWMRGRGHGARLEPIGEMRGWVSPLLGVRFEIEGSDVVLYHPNGRRFLSHAEAAAERDQAQELAAQAQERAEHERERAERLAARLRALGIDPDA